MPGRGVGTASVLDPRAVEVERLIDHSALRGSESLCRLLRYLANRAIQEPGATIREHEIAAEVFGRVPFDPRLDSTVRVNVTRLRAKLIEYYGGAGAEDPVVVDLPKGSYAVVFQKHAAEEPALQAASAEAPTTPAPVPRQAIRPGVNRLLLGIAIAMTFTAVMLAGGLLLERRGAIGNSAGGPPADNPSLRRFWGTLLNRTGEPWVVFSNANFVGRPATGMRYMVPERDEGREVLDFYTGIGEVLGVHALDRTFAMLNRSVRVKRGALLSLDDAKNNDLVYVGSPLENLTLRDMPGLQDLEFQLMASGPRRGEGILVNRAPRPGEPKVYLTSALPLTQDYAVVALVPGLNPARWTLILAGTSTIGTEAAVEFVCGEDTVSELLKKLAGAPPGNRFFEAVLEVQIKSGVPVGSKIVLFHWRHPAS
ncbi:MAG TPA: hypothetical protein VMB03_34610 [Bryobacteraceae bacterium]|nr:hypothetical protein [Bryobacteraceae bacterium]